VLAALAGPCGHAVVAPTAAKARATLGVHAVPATLTAPAELVVLTALAKLAALAALAGPRGSDVRSAPAGSQGESWAVSRVTAPMFSPVWKSEQ
jgi:hypothetical protein